MSALCNACYLASTEPRWLAQLMVDARSDEPCERHCVHSWFDDTTPADRLRQLRCAYCGATKEEPR